MDDEQFASLMTRVRAGDEQAVAELLAIYEPEVRMMVRARLPRILRKRLDSDDLLQSLWASLLVKSVGEGKEFEFEGPRHFLGYLAGAVHLKVLEQYRRQTRTKKYDLKREEPLEVRTSRGAAFREVAAPDPSPSQHVQAADRMAQLIVGRSPSEVLVLQLRRQGLTFEEIGNRVGLHERTVRRLIDTLRERMEARRWE